MRLVLFLTLAVVAPCATVGPTDRYLPLIHDGGGWSTQITVVNLAAKPAVVYVGFMTARGYNEVWKLGITTSVGKVSGGAVDLTLAPGASAVIETSGAPANLTRGFSEVSELADQPLGVFATLIQKDGNRVLQTIRIPLSPSHEKRSVLSLDLSNPASQAELIWLSLTSTATLEVVFRNPAGEIVLSDQVLLDNNAQVFVKVREMWPQLQDFRGTLQWSVTFPNADRYEPRILAGLAVVSRDGQATQVITGMTLPAEQASSSPY